MSQLQKGFDVNFPVQIVSGGKVIRTTWWGTLIKEGRGMITFESPPRPPKPSPNKRRSRHRK